VICDGPRSLCTNFLLIFLLLFFIGEDSFGFYSSVVNTRSFRLVAFFVVPSLFFAAVSRAALFNAVETTPAATGVDFCPFQRFKLHHGKV